MKEYHDTNLTHDSCKNCGKMEEEACRLELAWAAEIRMNNKLKKLLQEIYEQHLKDKDELYGKYPQLKDKFEESAILPWVAKAKQLLNK